MEEKSSMESYIKKEDFLFYEAETGKSDRDQESLQEDVKQFCVDEDGWIHMCAKPELPSTALSSDPQATETVLIALGQESVFGDDERIGENSQESSERESMPPTHQERNSVSCDVLIKEEIDSEQNEEGGRCFNEEKGESGDNDRGRNNESCECKVTEPTGSVCSYCKKKHERTDSGGKTSLQSFFCDRSFSKEASPRGGSMSDKSASNHGSESMSMRGKGSPVPSSSKNEEQRKVPEPPTLIADSPVRTVQNAESSQPADQSPTNRGNGMVDNGGKRTVTLAEYIHSIVSLGYSAGPGHKRGGPGPAPSRPDGVVVDTTESPDGGTANRLNPRGRTSTEDNEVGSTNDARSKSPASFVRPSNDIRALSNEWRGGGDGSSIAQAIEAGVRGLPYDQRPDRSNQNSPRARMNSEPIQQSGVSEARLDSYRSSNQNSNQLSPVASWSKYRHEANGPDSSMAALAVSQMRERVHSSQVPTSSPQSSDSGNPRAHPHGQRRQSPERSHLTRHLQSHVGIQTYDTFHCSLCKKSFLSNSDLVKHKTTCTGEKPYACIHCTSTFAKQMDLEIHSRTHNQVKNIVTVQTQDQTDHSYSQSQSQCPYCKRAFKTKSNLDSHIGTMTFESSYSCSHCSSSFRSKCSLTLHSRTHLEQKSYQCALCGKTFASLSGRNIHLKWHTGVKPHECSYCGKRFFHKGNLNVHIRIHTKEKPYKCDHCRKEFSDKKIFNVHMFKHSVKILPECSVRKEEFITSNCSIECSQNKSKSDDIRTITPQKTMTPRKTMTIESSYSCSHCSSTFPSERSLTLHSRTHLEQKSYQCPHCSKTFASIYVRNRHLKWHTGVKPHECLHCGKRFFGKGNLNVHIRIHTKGKLYKCDHCSEEFSYKKTFNMHMNKHSGKILQECSVRKEKFATSNSSIECSQNECHSDDITKITPQKSMTIESSYSCSHCSSSFPSKCSLSLHNKTHLEKLYQCSLCSKTFTTAQGKKTHMRRHTEGKRHQCSYCSKKFFDKTQLNEHVRMHTKEKPYKCDHCYQGFSYKKTFNLHMRKNSRKILPESSESQSHIKTCPEETPYQCSACNKTFSAECSLLLHERTHPRGPQEMHGCPLCSKRYHNKYSVYLHMRVHTGEKKYHCSYCPKAYTQEGQLADHLRTHTGERPFKCSQCDMAFMRKPYLLKHVKLHSGEKSQ